MRPERIARPAPLLHRLHDAQELRNTVAVRRIELQDVAVSSQSAEQSTSFASSAEKSASPTVTLPS
jgi:hypothetical protein